MQFGVWNWRVRTIEVILGVLERSKLVELVVLMNLLPFQTVVGRRADKQDAGRKPNCLAMTRAGVHIVRLAR